MAGKIRAALIRKEADIYRSQGLNREARDLYNHLLSSSSNIDAGTEAAIRTQIEQIRKAENEHSTQDERRKLSVELLAILKSGWGNTPTESDILVCAHALMELGCFAEALNEFKQLLQQGTDLESVIEPVGVCLAQLFVPGMLADAIDRLARESLPDPAAAEALRQALGGRLRCAPGLDNPPCLGLESRPPPEPRRWLSRVFQGLMDRLRRR
jgi:hypothetical protein